MHTHMHTRHTPTHTAAERRLPDKSCLARKQQTSPPSESSLPRKCSS